MGLQVMARSTSLLIGALMALAVAVAGALLPEPASAAGDAIYNFPFYADYRPNGTSRYYVAGPTPGTPRPGSPPVVTPPPVVSPPVQPPSGPPPGSTVELTAEEQRMLELVNQARARAGLPPLSPDPLLTQLARMKSQDMVDKGYFSHYSPTFGLPYQMEVNAGIRARHMGAENLGSGPDVEMAHHLLMASPGHRRNILNPNFTEIGIGVAHNGTGVVTTQLFIGN